MLALERAMGQGAPDLYAETAAHFLACHLLTHYVSPAPLRRDRRWDRALGEADEFMRTHLSQDLSLAQLATVAGLGTFQLLRAAKLVWGETPMRHLTRLRMELAARLLAQDELSITDIAFTCGYGSPAHFATAFRRFAGVSPRRHREQSRY
ncbi:helix-turn-helix domain-containing protein [Deinococcus marmoris]|uniref:helix-turn-helix domain-containing protein n=1 Tax=Deinococcus marmoris TaxID=249408 RepID=UPI00158E8954|nr:AraC family transcriptional regulator [Deinococcus marmoris]